MNPIVVYGTTYCGDCSRAKRILQQHGIAYEWINIEHDAAARAYVATASEGMLSVPVLRFPDGEVLVEPSNSQLREKLKMLYWST